ncbi:MAG: hypothetical protein ABFS23_00190 [Pseudomonadota bacterium]
MALRIKARWHDDNLERSVDETAGAIAFNAWRLAKDKAINLHGEDFAYESDRQRMDVILEYLVFQVQITDRIASGRLGMDHDSRRDLVVATAKAMARHVQENSAELFGPGDHTAPFIERLNARGAEYAEFGFSEDGPSYPFFRHLGYEIQQIMGTEGDNRWVIDQVMDKDGLEVYRNISRAIDSLFG